MTTVVLSFVVVFLGLIALRWILWYRFVRSVRDPPTRHERADLVQQLIVKARRDERRA